MSVEAFELSAQYWKAKQYLKGEFYNVQEHSKHLGFIIDGVFIIYYVNPENAEEKNIFLEDAG